MGAYAEAQYVIDELSKKIESTGMKLQAPTNVSVVNFDEAAKITWTDPDDVIVNGGIAAQWAGTRVIRKEGSAPASPTDGVIVLDSRVRDQYKTSPLIDSGLTNGTTYYYGIFPFTDLNQFTTSCIVEFTPTAILPNTPSLNSVTAGDEAVIAAFTNNSPEALVKIVYKAGSAPMSDTDGTVISNLSTSPVEINGLTNDVTYYFAAFAYTANRVSDRSAVLSATPRAILPATPTLDSATGADGQVSIAFTNSTAGTLFKLVYKTGSAPTSPTDGTVISGLTTSPVVVTGLTNGTKYYFAGYAYTANRTSERSNVLECTPRSFTAFAFHYTENDTDPASITYPAGYDNSNFTDPFYVNLSTGVPHWGDWAADAAKFLIPKSCMLKYDGTVDYYLNENDETKKLDGTASDVANSSYAGNAMMEWGQEGAKIYWKIVPDTDGKGFTFVVADAKLDNDMDAWNHYNCEGSLAAHFYTPKYFGSDDGTRLRSISGGTNYVSHTATEEMTKAKANNLNAAKPIWQTEVYCDWLFVQMLCMLFTKSIDAQSKFGYGFANGNSAAIGQGTMNGRGMFWGESTGKYGVKIFGMENPYGNLWRRIAGLINDNGTVKIKLTYGTQDGSTANGYNETGNGYISHGTTGGGTSGGYISHMNISNRGLTPNTMSGSDSTLYTDACWFNNSQVDYAGVGGDWNNGLRVGLFYVNLDDLASRTYAGIGAALSCKPLA